MRVVVTGGRDYQQKSVVRRILLQVGEITELAHGGAPGADKLSGEIASGLDIPVTIFDANWKTDGLAAGPKRNRKMLDEFKPDLVIAFPGGRGTANCVAEAKKRGIKVLEVGNG